MKSVHTVMKMLKKSANLENFDESEKLMFTSSYKRLHAHKNIRNAVNEGLSMVSRMIQNDWDDEMTYFSIELMNQEYNNTLFQKVVLVSLEKELEKKYFSLAA